MTCENDGRFPDESRVLVRYPLPGQDSDRATWPWLEGTVEQQCGPGEWLVTVEDRRVAVLEDGSPVAEGTADEDTFYPQAFRDQTELQAAEAELEAGGVSAAAGRREQEALDELIVTAAAERTVADERMVGLVTIHQRLRRRCIAAKGLVTRACKDGSAAKIAAAVLREEQVYTEFMHAGDQVIQEMLASGGRTCQEYGA